MKFKEKSNQEINPEIRNHFICMEKIDYNTDYPNLTHNRIIIHSMNLI